MTRVLYNRTENKKQFVREKRSPCPKWNMMVAVSWCGGHFSVTAPGDQLGWTDEPVCYSLKPSAFCWKPENKDKFHFSKWRSYIQTNTRTASPEGNESLGKANTEYRSKLCWNCMISRRAVHKKNHICALLWGWVGKCDQVKVCHNTFTFK